MKIAILTSGILPVPAVQGGAVENLVDFYLEYNDQHRLHDITVYSVWHPDVEKHPALKSEVNHYIYIKVNGWWAKLKKKIYQKTHGEEYYHYSIEYYLEQSLKHIKRQQYDLIVLENRPGYALKLKNATSAKLVYHLHNDILNNEIKQSSEIYEAASRIITVSNYIASRVKTIDANDNKCLTVYNGIDLEKFAGNENYPPQNMFTIVYIGRMIKEKGISELLDAMLLLKRIPNIRLVVIGGSFYANSSTNEFISSLKSKAKLLKDRIEFTGFIPYNQLPEYLHHANLAVLPSTWNEPFGLTCIEAMAAGLPIITTQSGGIPEIVTDKCAILLPNDDQLPTNISEAVLTLYNDKQRRNQMGKLAQKHVTNFSKETYASNLFDSLRSISKYQTT